MTYKSPQNPNSHLTVKEREGPSFPTKHLFRNNLIHGRVLDFGCGLGADVQFLQENGFDVTGYDPHYAPQEPQGKFDTILCNYVLNVLLPEEQTHVLMAVSELLEPTGTAYFAVRRDIKQAGFRTHVKHKCQTYQCSVFLPYPSKLVNDFCEIYAYRPINQLPQKSRDHCPLCAPPAEWELITESATGYAILAPGDRKRSGERQVLIVPKQHCDNYFELPERAKTACQMLLEHTRALLMKQAQATDFRVEIRVGRLAEQAFEHTHVILTAYGKD